MKSELLRESGRLVWADVAKGACILLVVLVHVSGKHYYSMDIGGSELPENGWKALNLALQPIRMPLFFLISGLFAANALRRPWKKTIEKRIVRPYYLYLVWLLLHAAFFAVGPYLSVVRTESPEALLGNLLFGTTNLWYLYALPVYFIAAKLFLPVGPVPNLIMAFLISASTAAGWIPAPDNGTSVLMCYVYFLLGCYFPDLVSKLAETASWARFVLVGFAYGLAILPVLYFGLMTTFGVRNLLSVVAIIVGVTASVLFSRFPFIRRPLTYIGRQTLPIYVFHLPLLAVIGWASDGLSDLQGVGALVLSAVYPALVSLVLVVASIILHSVLRSIGMRWLFQLPARLSNRSQRTSELSVPSASNR